MTGRYLIETTRGGKVSGPRHASTSGSSRAAAVSSSSVPAASTSSAPAVGPVSPASSSGPGVGRLVGARTCRPVHLVALDDDPAEAGRLEVGADRVDIPDEDDRRVIDVEMGGRRSRDSVDVDRLDVRPVAHQFRHVEPVDRQAPERPDDRTGRLEPQREDADEEVARGGQVRPVPRAGRGSGSAPRGYRGSPAR